MPPKKKGLPNSNKDAIKIFSSLTTDISKAAWRLSHARKSSPVSAYSSLVRLIRSNSLLKQKIFNQEFPNTTDKIKGVPILGTVSAEREIRWAGAYLSFFGKQLNEFIKLSKELEISLLLSDAGDSEAIFDLIQKRFGYSLWFIKNKIAFLQLSKGLEAQKKFAKEVRKDSDGITDYITFFVSIRNESTVTPNRFTNHFKRSLLKADFSYGLTEYFQFHIDRKLKINTKEIADILRFEASGSVIDYYNTLIEIAELAICNEYKSLFQPLIIALDSLSPIINDKRLKFIIFQLKNIRPAIDSFSEKQIETYNYFLKGKYKESYRMSLELLASNCADFGLIEIASCASTMMRTSPVEPKQILVEELIEKMHSIVMKSDNYISQINYLIKLAQNFSNFSWANGIANFVWREGSSNLFDTIDVIERFTASIEASINPFRVSSFAGMAFQENYARFTYEFFNGTLAASYALNLATKSINMTNEKGLNDEEIILSEAEKALHNKSYLDGLDLSNKLYGTQHQYFRQKAIKIKCHCLLNLNLIEECISFLTSVYVQNSFLRVILPITELENKLNESGIELFKQNVSLPIFYDILTRYFDLKSADNRAYAYEDFLLANQVEKPSQLKNNIDSFEREKIIYFLRHICIESVMDNSTIFESSREISEERLNICRLLVEINPDEADSYHDEIKEILRRLMTQKRMREIEQSKIYIDIEGIRKNVESTMKENFQRYISFVKNNFNANTSFEIKEAIKLADSGDFNKLIKIELPPNEMTDIFEKMIIELRDEFVSNSVHGLDGYLSVRIRHGTLEGQLRKPLEEANLITERDSATDIYKPNGFWINKLEIEDDEIINSLNDIRSYAVEQLFDKNKE